MKKMSRIKFLTIVIVLVCSSELKAQIKSECDKLYNLFPGVAVELNKAKSAEKNIANLKSEIIKICTEEALEGRGLSQFWLADINYRGFGKEKDIYKALYWYLVSEQQGILGSRIMLGQLFFDGKYISKDIRLSYYWFVKANSDLESFDTKFCLNFIDTLSDEEIERIEKKVRREEGVTDLGSCSKKLSNKN
ncbi:tetratricopeptide repeat protein [Kangiella sp. M94]